MKNDKPDSPLTKCEQFLLLYDEMETLFEFVPPEKLKRSLEFIFFYFLEHKRLYVMSDFRELFKRIHYLINFLDNAEDLLKKGK